MTNKLQKLSLYCLLEGFHTVSIGQDQDGHYLCVSNDEKTLRLKRPFQSQYQAVSYAVEFLDSRDLEGALEFKAD